ncbi:hypothetical protein CBR_g18978 [Chara braunii]|uniref:Uncharacterized protein n=1 Tax=Chara braunii TaxID=69332 RepID=A0A388KX03_CHABU|nr:hypothetical protein CBR_g18978 [Chara braunii]|eukprot:GBG74567.1 hypothetical protein CBR_g18978 [Chara braunii]
MAAAYSTSGIVRCHSEFTAKLVSNQKHHLSATHTAAAHSSTATYSAAATATAAQPPLHFSEVTASSSPSSSSSFSSGNRSRTRGTRPAHVLASPSPSPSPSPSTSTCLSTHQASATCAGNDPLFRVECHSSSSRSFRHPLGVESLPHGIERVVSRATWRPLRTCRSSTMGAAAEVDGTATDSSASASPSSPPPPPPSNDVAQLEEPVTVSTDLYVPLNTQQLVEQVTKMPISELAEDKGTVAEAEKAVLVGLSSHVRCVVSTLGGNEGAAARTDGWNHLHCGITVWVHCGAPDEDEETGRTIVTRAKMESSLPEPAPGTSYGKADVTVAVGLPQVRWESDATRPVAEGVLKALKQLLERDCELPGKKGLYRRLGCRGDWPYIMPPGWNPNPSEEGEASESEPNELEQLVDSLEGSTSHSAISGVHSEVAELLQASKREKDTAQGEQQQTTAIHG